MSFTTIVNVTGFLLLSVPIAVLVVGVILYFKIKTHRKTLGIVLITLSVDELAVFLWSLYIILWRPLIGVLDPYMGPPSYWEKIIFDRYVSLAVIFVVDLLTLLLGIIAYKKRLKEKQD